MNHTTFDGWGVVDARTQAAIDAGHPEWAELHMSWTGAGLAGSLTYFTGKPCKHGHVAPRYSNGGRCADCAVMQVTA